MVGRPLYEAFIKNYTLKQWGRDPKDLPPDIITRIPVRYNYREDYFTDAKWQGIPLDGYTQMFERLLDSPNIDVELNCDYFKHRNDFEIITKNLFQYIVGSIGLGLLAASIFGIITYLSLKIFRRKEQ